MTWADEIDVAMKRGNSPYSARDVFAWLRAGQAYFCATDAMHASIWFKDAEICEIGHVAGKWNNSDARFIFEKCQGEAQRKGYDKIVSNGRAGWSRFLQIKGWQT